MLDNLSLNYIKWPPQQQQQQQKLVIVEYTLLVQNKVRNGRGKKILLW